MGDLSSGEEICPSNGEEAREPERAYDQFA